LTDAYGQLISPVMVDSAIEKPWLTLGISKSWYYAIRSGKRTPSLQLAVHMYDITGEKTKPIEPLSDEEIAILRKTNIKDGRTFADRRNVALNRNTRSSARESHHAAEPTEAADEREGMAAR
jgi:DNA-binding XRE family transcriptional regulator